VISGNQRHQHHQHRQCLSAWSGVISCYQVPVTHSIIGPHSRAHLQISLFQIVVAFQIDIFKLILCRNNGIAKRILRERPCPCTAHHRPAYGAVSRYPRGRDRLLPPRLQTRISGWVPRRLRLTHRPCGRRAHRHRRGSLSPFVVLGLKLIRAAMTKDPINVLWI
jgi:hypothetical protein